MTDNAEQLWEWVDDRCSHLGIDSIRELERRAKVSHGTISSPKSQQRFPSIDLAMKMCKPLRVDFVQFWANSGVVNVLQPTGFKADILNLLDDLSENELREIYLILEGILRIRQK